MFSGAARWITFASILKSACGQGSRTCTRVWQIVRAHPSTDTKLRHECSGNSRAVPVSVILFNLSLLSLLCLASRFLLRNPIANLTSSYGISSLRVLARHWSGSEVARKTGGNSKTGVTERGPGHGPPPVRVITNPKGFFSFSSFCFLFFTLRMLRYFLQQTDTR